MKVKGVRGGSKRAVCGGGYETRRGAVEIKKGSGLCTGGRDGIGKQGAICVWLLSEMQYVLTLSTPLSCQVPTKPPTQISRTNISVTQTNQRRNLMH